MSEPTTIVLGPNDSALVVRADSTAELFIPKMEDLDAPAPVSAILITCAACAAKALAEAASDE